jgi:hypothetical protein
MSNVKVLLIYMHSKKQAGKPRNALMLFALILEKKREEEKERKEEREIRRVAIQLRYFFNFNSFIFVNLNDNLHK